MKQFKITILGNSVALRNRPYEKYPENKNYGLQLQELLEGKHPDRFITIQNMAFQRATVIDVAERIDNYISTFPDVYIINIGVCDAPTREIPFWFANIINEKKSSLKKSICAFLFYKIIKQKRSFFVRLRGKKQWVSSKKFHKTYEELVNRLKIDTNALIILLSINLASGRIEEELPGSSKNYIKYNQLIQEIAEQENCTFISLGDLNPPADYPDGTHFSLEGNKKVAERLFQFITGQIND